MEATLSSSADDGARYGNLEMRGTVLRRQESQIANDNTSRILLVGNSTDMAAKSFWLGSCRDALAHGATVKS